MIAEYLQTTSASPVGFVIDAGAILAGVAALLAVGNIKGEIGEKVAANERRIEAVNTDKVSRDEFQQFGARVEQIHADVREIRDHLRER